MSNAEFTGFPADGIWLVADGMQSCLIRLCDISSLPPITALPYLALVDEAATKIMWKLSGQAASWMDIAREVALFFAEKADELYREEKDKQCALVAQQP